MKQCFRCKKILPLTNFTINNRASDGLRGHCKLCAKKYKQRYLKKNPWATAYRAAKARCNNPKDKGYKYYGGKGIRFNLSLEEVQRLWFSAPTHSMKRPSIDRFDTERNYDIYNCRFIEHKENVAKSNRERAKRVT